MAKKIKTGYDVSGLSIEDIMEMDIDTFNSLNERQLRQVTSRLVSASNKRIRKLKQKNINSPAVQSLGTRDSFSVKLPKDITSQQRVNALRQEYASARNFLTSKTSTIRGYNRYVKSIKSKLADDLGMSVSRLNKVNLSKAFDILHKMQESGQLPSNGKGSIHARDYIIQNMLNGDRGGEDEQKIIDDTLKDYERYYEQQESKDNEEDEEWEELDEDIDI